MDPSANSIYNERIAVFAKEQASLRRLLSLISILRIGLFFVFAWFVYTAFRERFAGNEILLALATLAVFIILVLFSGRKKTRFKFLQQLVIINRNEIDIASGKPSFLPDGIEYPGAFSANNDLGIFGKDSLFHLLNRTGSLPGGEQLAQRLANPFLEEASILNYQAAAKELAGKIIFRQTLLAHTLLLEEEEALPQLKTGVPFESFAVVENAFWKIVALTWPVAGVLLSIYSVWIGNYRFLLPFGFLGLVMLSFTFRKVSQLYNHISKRSYLYNQYARCFRLINEETFEHPYLLEKQKQIAEASLAFHRLAKLTGLFDLRMSLFSPFINGLFLLDLICAQSYLKWNRQYQSRIAIWFDTLGEIELLNSIATFSFNHPSFIFPQPVAGKLSIEGSAMGHPLMREQDAVVNDVAIGGDHPRIHIITGSNMSGKSTFLRTLGLNMVLAQTGAPVFAGSFLFRPVRFLTSFHHIDSLAESTSYFYAELRALQQIIQSLDHPAPALVLLDEVMRGTNSKDKHDGTALLIKKLIGFDALTLIATHDTELGVLAKEYPGEIDNFSFESELSDNGLTFDFKKRTGVAQSTNATYLMQQMGII